MVMSISIVFTDGLVVRIENEKSILKIGVNGERDCDL